MEQPRTHRQKRFGIYSSVKAAVVVLLILPVVVIAAAGVSMLVARAVDARSHIAYEERLAPLKAWELKRDAALTESAIAAYVDAAKGSGTWAQLEALQKKVDECEEGIHVELDKQEIQGCVTRTLGFSRDLMGRSRPECGASFAREDSLRKQITALRLSEPYFSVGRQFGGPFDDLSKLRAAVRTELAATYKTENPPPGGETAEELPKPVPWPWTLDWGTAAKAAAFGIAVHLLAVLATIPYRRRLSDGKVLDADTRMAITGYSPPIWFWVVAAICLIVAVGFYGWNIWYDNLHGR